MAGICDHTSVGMLVWKEGKILLIERAKFPFGFALPAGHVDGDASFEIAAQRELEEEVGLKVESLKLIAEGRKENMCRRTDGTWHYWKIYEAETSGELQRSIVETKGVGWYSKEELHQLAKMTEQYIRKEIRDEEWEKNPGLEPVMYEWFRECSIL